MLQSLTTFGTTHTSKWMESQNGIHILVGVVMMTLPVFIYSQLQTSPKLQFFEWPLEVCFRADLVAAHPSMKPIRDKPANWWRCLKLTTWQHRSCYTFVQLIDWSVMRCQVLIMVLCTLKAAVDPSWLTLLDDRSTASLSSPPLRLFYWISSESHAAGSSLTLLGER